MKLCGLDFETANSCNGSICAVGAALFEDGIVFERMEHLIKPHKSMDYMSKFCRDTHGIFYEDLRKVRKFRKISFPDLNIYPTYDKLYFEQH